MATESTVGSRKKGRQESANGAFPSTKKLRPSIIEMESFATGIGTKSKPCTKFFSPSGCPFGEGCHFLHYVPGGLTVVSQMLQNVNSSPSRKEDIPSGPGVVKMRMCNKYNTPEGCKFGDQCRFAHSERELGQSIEPAVSHQMSTGGRRLSGKPNPGIPPPTAAFGASAKAKISVDASLAGAIIGKGGVNSKHICRVTGAKLSIRDHESDPNSKNIEMEGSFDQIDHASALVRDLIDSVSAEAVARSPGVPFSSGHQPVSNFKMKLCANYSKGMCTFADRCRFAHGATELNIRR